MKPFCAFAFLLGELCLALAAPAPAPKKPKLIKAGHYYEKIAVNDIAPTLAAIVGVEQPSGSVGRVLQEIWQ